MSSPPYRSVSDEIENIIMKTSFKPRVSRMGLGSFRNINIFEIKYFFSVCLYSPFFFESLKSKSAQMLRPQKGNLEVLFNDTL